MPRTVRAMTAPVHAGHRRLLPALLLGGLLVAGVGLAGWLLLLFVKGTVVLVSYALGIALVALPLLLAPRLVRGSAGAERRQRVATIAQVVAVGAVLCVLGYFVGRHGWLLVAVPAAAVGLMRLAAALRTRRQKRGLLARR
jgi:hypothetical protein